MAKGALCCTLAFVMQVLLASALCVHSVLEGMALGAQQTMQATESIMIAIAGTNVHALVCYLGVGVCGWDCISANACVHVRLCKSACIRVAASELCARVCVCVRVGKKSVIAYVDRTGGHFSAHGYKCGMCVCNGEIVPLIWCIFASVSTREARIILLNSLACCMSLVQSAERTTACQLPPSRKCL